MKSDYRVRAEKFIYSIFKVIENNLNDPSTISDLIYEYNWAHNRKIKVSYGCSRVALITSDYVVKWVYDEENADEVGGCVDEYYFYQYAKECGFAYLFAEMTLFDYRGITFGIMPRIPNVGFCHHAGCINEYLSRAECDWLSRNVNDLHHGNWGIKNGHVKIVDYGFNSKREAE